MLTSLIFLKGLRRARLQSALRTPERTVEFCRKLGLLSKRRDCAICGDPMTVCYNRGRNGNGITYRCMKGYAGEVSIRSGTFFARSHLPISSIVYFMYLLARDLINPLALSL
jgi:hypothetical protein